ncbi:MAG: isoprenylcysteine carboxylmethyltransferase family protein [Dermatophilaceae bacterium]
MVVGVVLNVLFPAAFAVGGPPQALRVGSLVVLLAGLVIWVWTVVLILRDVPRGRLITGGPYSIVRHPLYTGVALLVLPWAGLLLNTWLGVALGAVLYVASRMFSPAEEAELSRTFGARWDEYSRSVKIPWL